jgi:hypothetical protein
LSEKDRPGEGIPKPQLNASLDLDKHGSKVVDEPLEAEDKTVPASFAARVRAQDRDTAMAP